MGKKELLDSSLPLPVRNHPPPAYLQKTAAYGS
jgi:hypothetical protein